MSAEIAAISKALARRSGPPMGSTWAALGPMGSPIVRDTTQIAKGPALTRSARRR